MAQGKTVSHEPSTTFDTLSNDPNKKSKKRQSGDNPCLYIF